MSTGGRGDISWPRNNVQVLWSPITILCSVRRGKTDDNFFLFLKRESALTFEEWNVAELHEQVANYWWTWYWQFQWQWFWSILAWLSSSLELTIALVRIIGVWEHWSGRSSSTKALEGWFVNITTIIRLSAISPLLMCMCFVFLSWSLHSTLISTKWVLKVEHLQTSLVRATTTTSFPPPLSSLANTL